jgi:hypothetical protein
MKQKKKIRKRRHVAPTKARGVVSKDGVRCAHGSKKLKRGERPWLSFGSEYFME